MMSVLIAMLLAGANPVAEDVRAPVAVGYTAIFRGLDKVPAQASFSHYSHINLAFANPSADGALVAGDSMACMQAGGGTTATIAQLEAVISRVHAAGAKALVSLGGGTIPTCSGDWAALVRQDARGALVDTIVALVDRLGLDGVDIDLEGALLTAIDQQGNYTPFIAQLGAALRARGKLLTCATASYEGGMIPKESIRWFDLINVMSYDQVGPSWGQPGNEQSTLAQAQIDLDLWRESGVARDQLVLGVPFYGHGFGSYNAAYATRDLLAEFPGTAGDVVGTPCAGCSYITFNGVATLRAKGEMARAQGAGIMVWEVAQDTDDFALITAARGETDNNTNRTTPN